MKCSFDKASFPRWLALADREFAAANKMFPALKDKSAWHYHQSAERYLKAFLVSQDALQALDPSNEIVNLRKLASLCNSVDPAFLFNCPIDLSRDGAMLDKMSAWECAFELPPEPGNPDPVLPTDAELFAARGICLVLRRGLLGGWL
jgi:hypothetical protein